MFDYMKNFVKITGRVGAGALVGSVIFCRDSVAPLALWVLFLRRTLLARLPHLLREYRIAVSPTLLPCRSDVSLLHALSLNLS